MDKSSSLINGSGHLNDFQEYFEGAVSSLSVEEKITLANQFSKIMSDYDEQNITLESMATLVDKLMDTLVKYPGLVVFLNINSDLWRGAQKTRISENIMSSAYLERNVDQYELQLRVKWIFRTNESHFFRGT